MPCYKLRSPQLRLAVLATGWTMLFAYLATWFLAFNYLDELLATSPITLLLVVGIFFTVGIVGGTLVIVAYQQQAE
jgi:hypothetical protein